MPRRVRWLLRLAILGALSNAVSCAMCTADTLDRFEGSREGLGETLLLAYVCLALLGVVGLGCAERLPPMLGKPLTMAVLSSYAVGVLLPNLSLRTLPRSVWTLQCAAGVERACSSLAWLLEHRHDRGDPLGFDGDVDRRACAVMVEQWPPWRASDACERMARQPGLRGAACDALALGCRGSDIACRRHAEICAASEATP